jgi:hypothetical protein
MYFEIALTGAIAVLTMLYWNLSVRVAAQDMMINVLVRLFIGMIQDDEDRDTD